MIRRPTVSIVLEIETESRLQKIEDHYGSLCTRTSVAKTAMELGLLLMAGELEQPLLNCEKEQLKELKAKANGKLGGRPKKLKPVRAV